MTILTLDPDTQLTTVNDPSPTVSVLWDQAVQQAVINTAPGPTVASRAYAMLHTAMFAAYRVLEELFPYGSSRFESDLIPQEAITLEWGTFSEAADEAGISRIYRGIHFDEGDQSGPLLGQQVGASVWKEAQFFIKGGKGEPEPPTQPDSLVFCGPEDTLFKVTRPRHNFDGARNTVFAGARNDRVDTSQLTTRHHRIFDGVGLDELLAGWNDHHFKGSSTNILNVTPRISGNHLLSRERDDELFARIGDSLLGERIDDRLINASVGGKDNYLHHRAGNDILIARCRDRLLGIDSNDSLLITGSDDNLLTRNAETQAI